MPITYVIKFKLVAGQLDTFHKLLNGVLDAMRHEQTFHEAILHRDPRSEHQFMLYETWADHDDVVDVQLHRPYRRTWHDALSTILEGEREISIWEPTRADRSIR